VVLSGPAGPGRTARPSGCEASVDDGALPLLDPPHPSEDDHEEDIVKPLAMFPGQGSQRPGMAADLLTRYPAVTEPVFALADELLGMPLTQLCREGDAGELRQTEVTQPAILVTSLATLAVLRQGGFRPAAAAGHSLGEYAALVTAGVLAAESALRLVRRRGELMAEVAATVPGAMAAVIGLPIDDVEALCAGATGTDTGTVEVANLNEPLQIVVSGNAAAVDLVQARALEAGAEHVVKLVVGAAFHSSLMSAMTAEFTEELARYAFADPEIPVFSAVTADLVATGEDARRLLEHQLTAPVRWCDTLRRAVAAGYGPLVETGPGRVLAGFAKRIAPDAAVHGTATVRSIASLLGRTYMGPAPLRAIA
jgi:[acyl-carrier-protein] S-malonyltransferase